MDVIARRLGGAWLGAAWLGVVVTIAVAGCGSSAAPVAEGRGPGPSHPSPRAPGGASPRASARIYGQNGCGSSPQDWCAPRRGDPCEGHRDRASCEADPRCEGMPYTGESVAACQLTPDCRFATNCPTVGCWARCGEYDETTCGAPPSLGRCEWNGKGCVPVHPCATLPSAAPPAAAAGS